MARRFVATEFVFGLVTVSCTSGSDESAPDSTANPPTASESATTEPVASDAPTTTGAATTTADTAAPVTTSEVAAPDTAPTATAELDEDVFSFLTDELCQWVTEDEVAEIVSAVYPWNGSAVGQPTDWSGAIGDGSSGCLWTLTDGEENMTLQADDASKWVPTNGTAPATTNSNTTDISTLAAGDVNQPGGRTITVSLDAIEGLSGLVVDAWVLPVELNEDKDAIGGTSFWPITDDPFSASKKIQPQNKDAFWEVVTTGESPIVEPGTYRFDPLRFGTTVLGYPLLNVQATAASLGAIACAKSGTGRR